MSKGWHNALSIGSLSFVLAIISTFISQEIILGVPSIVFSFLLLIFIITVGVVFDIIGVAVTAARETSLHARAAKKVKGAKEALELIRNADRIASFCNDVVGDIAGTLGGAVGAAIIFQIFTGHSNPWWNAVMTSSIAALMIGGKAWGKSFALSQPDEIVFRIGQLVAEMKLGRFIFKEGGSNSSSKNSGA